LSDCSSSASTTPCRSLGLVVSSKLSMQRLSYSHSLHPGSDRFSTCMSVCFSWSPVR
jgi:hypothetical protein